MNSNELYEEFLTYFKEYERDLDGIVIKKEATCLKINKPHNPEKNKFLIYQIIGNSRVSGTISNIDDLLELYQETFGESFIINNGYDYGNDNYYNYGYDYGETPLKKK